MNVRIIQDNRFTKNVITPTNLNASLSYYQNDGWFKLATTRFIKLIISLIANNSFYYKLNCQDQI